MACLTRYHEIRSASLSGCFPGTSGDFLNKSEGLGQSQSPDLSIEARRLAPFMFITIDSLESFAMPKSTAYTVASAVGNAADSTSDSKLWKESQRLSGMMRVHVLPSVCVLATRETLCGGVRGRTPSGCDQL